MDAKKLASLFDNPNFAKWFGKSKTIGTDGEPMVLYHGGKFNETADPVFDNKITFLSPDKKLAQAYSPYSDGRGVTSAYVKVENPFNPQNPDHVYAPWVEDWVDFWRKEDGWVDRATGDAMSNDDVMRMIEDTRLYDYDAAGSRERWNDFLGTATEHHDGFYGYDPTDGGVVVAAFDPRKQIKSVNNRGTFDPNDPNILKAALPFAAGAGLMSMLPSDAEAVQRIREKDLPLEDAWNPFEAFATGVPGGLKAAAMGVLPDGAMDWAFNRIGGLMSGGGK